MCLMRALTCCAIALMSGTSGMSLLAPGASSQPPNAHCGRFRQINYWVDVTDNGEPGSANVLRIAAASGYAVRDSEGTPFGLALSGD
jgi:hypothetical protein